MSKAHILLIDDDPQFLETMQFVLEMEDYRVTSMPGLEDVESLARSIIPDLILVDYCLKGTDGGKVCRELRENEPTADLPIVLLSAYPQTQLPLNNIPFTVFIPKPFDLWEFLARLEELIVAHKH